MWESLAEDGLLEDAVVEFVRQRDWVTLVELQRHMADYMETKGNILWEIVPGVVLWAGMSEIFTNLVMGLVEKKRIFLHPTVPLTYFVDGGMLRMPVAKRPPKNGYKQDHWLPVCLRVVPLKGGKGRNRNDRYRPSHPA